MDSQDSQSATEDYSCDILAKNVVYFWPCPKSFYGAILKATGLNSLAEEISRQPSINCAVWLSVITSIQLYNEKEQFVQQENTKNRA